MVEIDKIVLKNIRTFLDRLDTAGIHVTKAYLFGSHLTGRADQWSDIDVAVISPQISDDRIEPLPFSPDGFAEDDPLVREIINKGFVI